MSGLFDLTGQVCLVTGGNGGIGLGMAEGMAVQGADVVIWGRNAKKNAEAKARLEKTGRKVATNMVDVSDEAAVQQGITDIVAEFGRLDTAVANAGMSSSQPSLFDIETEQFNRVMEVNVNGVFFTLREAARHMVERAKAGDAGGALVGIASTAAIHGAARNEHYAASKGGVVTLCRAMAVELARYRIAVNSICPGWVRSEMSANAQANEKFNERVIGRVPMKGWGDPEDFGAIAAYLSSPASRYHTGDTIVVDGAYTIF